MTERVFLEELSMAAWQMDAYFPATYRQWKNATGAEKDRLNREFGIERQLDDIVYHFRNTVFIEFLVQEMARFFKCRPNLKDVVDARNEYSQRDYWKYVNDLFAAAKLQAMGREFIRARSDKALYFFDYDDHVFELDAEDPDEELGG